MSGIVKLYHHPFCPFCRKVRLVLAEKEIEFTSSEEAFWQKREEFLALNPVGQVPLLIDRNGAVIVDSSVILEYIEATVDNVSPLLPRSEIERAEVRRLCLWFDRLLFSESVSPILEERCFRRLRTQPRAPNSLAVISGCRNLHKHLDYIGKLLEHKSWLAGDQITWADYTAAAHLSCIDYFDDIDWSEVNTEMLNWYARIKSRPAFRSILSDRLTAVEPAAHYADPDSFLPSSIAS